MKRITVFRTTVCILVAVMLCGVLGGCSAGEVTEPVFEDNKTLHIGAWIAPPPGYITDENYQAIADAGINCIYALYEGADSNGVKALELADKYHIGYLLRDWSLGSIQEDDFDLLPDMLSKYEAYPAFRGHLVSDEPGANAFDRLGKMKHVYDRVFGGEKLFYVNLFSTYSSLTQRDGREYAQYLDEYIEKVKPSVISYDHYPLLKNVDGTSVTEDYLLNLELVSKASVKSGIPFWNFIQTMAFGLVNREPDYEDMRWQAYSTLAFGGQGIQHFCYWTPKSGEGSFGQAMIDQNGNKTPLYDYASRLNHELLAFDHIYLSYHPVGQMVFPQEGGPNHTWMNEPLSEFEPVKTVEGDPVLMGCFEDDNGHPAIMLVNMNDPGNGQTVDVTVTFRNARALNVYTEGVKERVDLQKKTVTLTLGVGEGKFIQILQ